MRYVNESLPDRDCCDLFSDNVSLDGISLLTIKSLIAQEKRIIQTLTAATIIC
jgi:hypothetical protein